MRGGVKALDASLRASPLAIAGLVILLCVVALGYLGSAILQQQSQLGHLAHNGLWASSQALQEATNFRVALHRYGQADPAVDFDALELQFDLLHSRIALFKTGFANQDFLLIDQMAEQLPVLFAKLDQLEAALTQAHGRDAATLGRLETTAEALQARLTQLNLAYHHSRLSGIEFAEERRLETTFIASGALLLAALALLAGLLVRKWRRANQLLVAEATARKEVAGAEQTLRALVDALPAMVVALDAEGRSFLVNDAHKRFHGLPGAATRGMQALGLGLAPDEVALLPQKANRAAAPGFVERPVIDHVGRSRTLLTRIAALPDSGGQAGRVVRVALDITEVKQAEARARHVALHDALTGLPNRGSLLATLHAAMPTDVCVDTPSVALHCIDLDRFKDINDSLGHDVGDQLLVAAAERLRGCLAQGDLVARLSGDEFAIVQHNVHTHEAAHELAQRAVAVLSVPFQIADERVHVGACIGTALAPDHATTVEAILQRAQIALHHAKTAGPSEHAMFGTAMEQDQADRLALESDLRLALDRDEITLVYQPKFDLPGRTPYGVEALARWQHPTRGPVPPTRFVALAETCGLVGALTRRVLGRACQQLAEWHRQGRSIPVAVNISAVQFRAGQAAGLVQEALASSGAPAHLLSIEVTEGAFIGDGEAARHDIAALQEMGVQLALDDFGTGYSSLAYLSKFPFELVKIDRSFVLALNEPGPRGRAMVEAVIRLSHSLGARTVAEGVELESQLVKLEALGCDQVQGYLLGRPMAPAQVSDLFAPGQPVPVMAVA
jgi:diguanylate cyclase (GGDEF)-like protein/PAS domain S-box-containing protein